MPLKCINCFQKVLKKIGSRFDTMPVGNPCSRTTSSRKTEATTLIEKPSLSKAKCAPYVSQSTTTKMAVNPADEGGLMIKSIVNWLHGFDGIGSGWSNPYALAGTYFDFWHVKHCPTKSVKHCFIPAQENCSRTLL